MRWCLLALLAGPAGAANLLLNPSFENADAEGRPTAWSWDAGRAGATATVDDTVARSGRRALKIVNRTPREPHVFSLLSQRVRLQPGQPYTLSAWVKGEPGAAWLGGGPGWQTRQSLPAAPDWRRIQLTFTPADDTPWQVVALTEGPTAGFWLDDLQLEPGDRATEFRLPAPLAPGELRLTVTPAGEGTNRLPNASFEQLTDGQPTGWRWDPRNTDATVTVVTPGHFGRQCLKITNGTAYGAHVYGHLVCAEAIPVEPGADYTLSFYCRTEGDPGIAWVGGPNDWRVRLRIPDTKGLWRRISGTFRPVAGETSAPIMILTESPTAGFFVDDIQLEAGREATAFDAPDTPLPAQLDLLPGSDSGVVPAPWKPDVYPLDRWAFVESDLVLSGGAGLPEPLPGARLELTVGGTTRAAPLPEGARRFHLEARFGLTGDEPRPLPVTARLLDPAGQPLGRTTLNVEVVTARQVVALLQDLERRLTAARARATADDYQLVTTTVAENFIGFCRSDLEAGAIARAWDTAHELTALLDRAARAMARPRAPRYVTSKLEIAGPGFLGEVRLPDGRTVRQPVWFTGYGHFGQVKRDVEKFPGYGNNLIQVEFGPRSVLVAEEQVSTAAIDDFLRLCDRAAAAGVAVNLLLSPHYFPQWALDKWPHLGEFGGGFLRYSPYADESRQVLDKYLRVVIPAIRDHPALHSVCLSNEPLSVDLTRDPAARRLWREWLTKRFGDVATINARWGTTYHSLADIAPPPPRYEASALVYDFTLFNQEIFADWHRWLAGVVRELAPGLPVHAKIMMSPIFQRSLAGTWSIAPELFAQLSQINGNDCFKGKSAPGWACAWLTENMAYDYQRSAADTPVFNSENHHIRDGDVETVQPELLYNVHWQGAIHGQGATTNWVWERTLAADHDFTGSILHRPACVEQVGWATLDLNRAAREVYAIASQPAELALLWSHASNVWRGDVYGQEVGRVYTAANFVGLPLGFVTERDCAAWLKGEPNRACGTAKIILVAGATHLPATVVEALRRFQAAGGRVQLLGEVATFDEAGRPLATRLSGATWPLPEDRAALAGLRDRLRTLATEAGLTIPLPVAPFGVEVRSAPWAGGWAHNLCNYAPEPVTVELPRGVDVLSGAPVGGPATLPPLGTRLVRTTD